MTDLSRQALDHHMRCVLARLEMVSNGTITSYNSGGGTGGDSPDPRPRGGSDAPHLYWRVQYMLAGTDTVRASVIDGADEEWRRITGRGDITIARPSGETDDEYRARILRETAKCSPAEVAQSRHAITERTLRKWRRDAGLNTETGVEDAETVVSAVERRRLVAARKQHGMTLRQIAFSLGISHETVRRDLQDAA